jgi:hypothetical protein
MGGFTYILPNPHPQRKQGGTSIKNGILMALITLKLLLIGYRTLTTISQPLKL